MPQAAFAGDIAYDWELWIGRTADSVITWTQILGFEGLPFPDQVPEDIDVTHMQSPGRARETVPGLLPVADWSQEKQLWYEAAGDVLLKTLSDLTRAGTKEDVLIEFNLIPDGSGFRETFRGYVNSYIPTGTVGDKAMASLSLKIMDPQPTNVRDIAASAAPANTVLPAISGLAVEAETLTAIEGIWTNSPSYTYQWQESIASVWTNITAATAKTLVVPGGDTIGRPLRVRVTGTNSVAAVTADSAPTAAVVGA